MTARVSSRRLPFSAPCRSERAAVSRGRPPTAASAIAALLTAMCIPQAIAESMPYTGYITSSEAELYSGPGTDYYPTERMTEGQPIEVYREAAGGWLAIRPPSSSYSWIPADHVVVGDDGLGEVVVDGVAAYVGSRFTNARDITQVRLDQGELVEILAEFQGDRQRWYRIAPPAGEFRWIAMSHVSREPFRSANAANTGQPLNRGERFALSSHDRPPTKFDATPAQQPEATVEPNRGGWRQGSATSTVGRGTNSDAFTSPPLGGPTAQRELTAPPILERPQPAVSHPRDLDMPAQAIAATPLARPVPGHQLLRSRRLGVSSEIARRLDAIELEISQIIADEPPQWDLSSVYHQAATLLESVELETERRAVHSVMNRIARFEEIAIRYQELSAPQERMTGLPADLPPSTAQRRRRLYQSQALGAEAAAAIDELAPPFSAGGRGLADAPVAGADRFDAVGELRPVVSRRSDAPRYALVNQEGEVISFVTPSPEVSLQPYLGQEVGIMGTRGFLPKLQRSHVFADGVSALSPTIRR